MNAEQFSQFLEMQKQAMAALISSVKSQPAAPAVGSAAASSVPRPPPLELEGDMEQNFNFFESNWKTYASAVGMDVWPATQNRQKTSILLSVVGKDALKKYFNFELNNAQQNDPDLALAAIKQKVVRERNKFVDWFDFFSLMQDATESIDDYLCRMKSIAKMCKFGALEEDMIKYKLATSVKWYNLRSKLISTQNFTEAQAVDFCRAEEISERHPIAEGQHGVAVNKVMKKKLKCKFCGARHDFTKGTCPALGKKCNRCGGKNHFEKVCKAGRKKKYRVKEVHDDSSSTDSESSVSSECASIGKIINESGSDGHVWAELELCFAGKWQTAQCELDTGAKTSLVGCDWLKSKIESDKIELLPSVIRLQGFGGTDIPVIGEVKIPCWRKGKKYKLVLQVVDGSYGPLLSANVCRILGLVNFCKTVQFVAPKPKGQPLRINQVKAHDNIKHHDKVFHGIDKLFEPFSLETWPSNRSVIHQPRRVLADVKTKDELRSIECKRSTMKNTHRTGWSNSMKHRKEKRYTLKAETVLEFGRPKPEHWMTAEAISGAPFEEHQATIPLPVDGEDDKRYLRPLMYLQPRKEPETP